MAPPVAVMVCEKAVPTVPVVVMAPSEMTGQILSVYGRLPVQPFASVAVMVRLVPAPFEAVGVPLSTPAVVNVRPAGSVPLVTVKLCGAVPPVAVIVCE